MQHAPELISAFLWHHFARVHDDDRALDDLATQRLHEAAARAAQELEAGAASAHVSLPFLAAAKSGPRHLDVTFTPADLAAFAATGSATTAAPQPPAEKPKAGGRRRFFGRG